MNKQETIADIIAEMRALSNSISDGIIAINGRRVADRLESAWKRESATTENSSAVGDAAKLREVVELLARVILPPQEEYPAEYGGGIVPDEDGWLAWIRQMQVRACAALAAPPRNCDVGDADDWEKRFGEECDNSHTCSVCPVRHAKTKMAIEFNKGARCEFIWAQMPYEEGGANE